ncbi:MAG: hypothetical protein NTX79_05970 [Candidatus Micrarchaeota archaeon]|nr:hypothetical protein [Candidatus Micrarchaeota archaeon]
MNVMASKDTNGRTVLMPSGQKKWSDFPIGAAFPPNGQWKGQPQLVERKGPNFEMSRKDMDAFQAFFDQQGKSPKIREAVAKALAEMEQNKGKAPWLKEKAKTQEYKLFPGEPTV